MQKYFTLESARRLLPEVRRLIAQAMRAREEMAGIREHVEAFSEKVRVMGGVALHAGGAGAWRLNARRAAARMQEALESLNGLGVLIKDLDEGLVDFPALYRGEEVLLCWRMGEADIAWWHGVEEGFRGRKPVDEDFKSHHDGGGPPRA